MIGIREIKQAVFIMELFKLGQEERTNKSGTENTADGETKTGEFTTKTVSLLQEFYVDETASLLEELNFDQINLNKLAKLPDIRYHKLPNIFKDK